MAKGKFIFNFNRKIGEQLVIPNSFNINEFGEQLDLRNHIKEQIGISSTMSYTDNEAILRFESDLDIGQEIKLSGIVEAYSLKSGLTDIERAMLTYLEDKEDLSKNFNTYIDSVNSGYTETGWSAMTYVEKKIAANLFVSTNSESLEVFSQDEIDEFNFFKLYRFLTDDKCRSMVSCERTETPMSIDYKKDLRQRLHPDFKFDRFGFMTGCTYYENITISYDAYGFTVFTYDNPILNYDADYTFADNGYVSTRTIHRKWYKMDGTLSDVAKTTFKVYDPMVARDEARRRRKNLINDLLIKTVGLFIITSPDLSDVATAEMDAIPFLKDINPAISAYYEYGTKVDVEGHPCQLIQEIAVHSYSRLDNFVPGTSNTVTIRMFIMGTLNPQ